MNTLRSQTNQRITHTFYFSVDRCFARKNDHNQLQTIVGRFEKFKHRFHLFNTCGILAEARLTNNGHASIVRYTLKLLSEGSKTIQRQRTALSGRSMNELPERSFVAVSLRSKTCDSPCTNFDTCVKLFSSHIPYTLIGCNDNFRLKSNESQRHGRIADRH